MGCVLLETPSHRSTDYGDLLGRAEVPGSLDEQWLAAGLDSSLIACTFVAQGWRRRP